MPLTLPVEVAMTHTAHPTPAGLVSPADFLTHWQGHRLLTRRVIGAFPEADLFAFTPAPPLRPFGGLAWEVHGVSAYALQGLTTNDWGEPVWEQQPGETREALLSAWDDLTRRLDAELPTVPAARYAEQLATGWGPMTGWKALMGMLDHEVHHRGQGYVYLRALGLTPPDFWGR